MDSRGQGAKEDALPLDPDFYQLSADEAIFFKKTTGINDDDDLKQHVLTIQAEAYKIYPYPCLRRFDFARLKISHHPAYHRLLDKANKNSSFLDIGCCFGNDIQKVVMDGFPVHDVIGSDLRQEFWQLGRRLFIHTPDITFIGGNIFDDAFLDIHRKSLKNTTIERSDKENISTLTHLQGHFSVIHAAALFHLFDEDQQTDLAKRLAFLLSSVPGSMIFGSHVSRPQKGLRQEAAGLGALGAAMFCHSDKSWKQLWNGTVFEPGTVQVETSLEEMSRVDLRPRDGVQYYQLTWTVTII